VKVQLTKRQRTAPQAIPSAERGLGGSAPNYFQMYVCTLTRIVCFIALSIHQPERQRTTPQAKPPKQQRDAAAL
jgi:hypothetical protein